MKNFSIVVLDLGGTKVNVGRYRAGKIEQNIILSFDSNLSVSDSIDFLADCVSQLRVSDTVAIAIGVPSIVDIEKGVVYNAVNIQSWEKVHLKDELQSRCGLSVYVNNDVNCFAKGEQLVGVGLGCKNMIGLCLGTGLGAGIIVNGSTYSGVNCCAGEVGAFSYLDSTLDEYCSGKFFRQHSNQCGSELEQSARAGNKQALELFSQYGRHLSVAISHLLLIFDPEIIVVGGSVANSFDLFIHAVWQSLGDFPYQNVIENLSIKQSNHPNSALIGAAHFYLESVE